jgi:hypothetical protein
MGIEVVQVGDCVIRDLSIHHEIALAGFDFGEKR